MLESPYVNLSATELNSLQYSCLGWEVDLVLSRDLRPLVHGDTWQLSSLSRIQWQSWSGAGGEMAVTVQM